MVPLRSVLGLAMIGWLACAAQKRPLDFRDIIELREPSQPRISLDGTRVAFVLTQASLASNSSRSSLWVASAGAPPRILLDEAVAGPVEWTPGGAGTPVVAGSVDLSSFHFTPDRRRAVCIRQSFTEPPEVALVDMTPSRVNVLTKPNPEFDGIALQPATERRWRSLSPHTSSPADSAR